MSTDLFGGEHHAQARAHRTMGRTNTSHDEWLTPPHITDALGPFDLDPAAPVVRPWDTAHQHYTVEDDGLRQHWQGFVWLNPPYAHWTIWLNRLARHGDGIALIFARTETRDFHTAVWQRAEGLLFLQGRLTFHGVDGRRAVANSGAPSVLVAYGARAADRLAVSGLPGALVTAWHRTTT